MRATGLPHKKGVVSLLTLASVLWALERNIRDEFSQVTFPVLASEESAAASVL